MPDDLPPTADDPTQVVAKHAEFPQLDAGAAPTSGVTLDSLRDVPITITAQLGHTVLPIADILKLGPGAVVELEETIDRAIELTVRGVPFAIGEVVVVDNHFAVRIKSLMPGRGRADR